MTQDEMERAADIEEAGVKRAFDALDAMADAWAERCDLVAMSVKIAGMIDRPGRIVGLAKLAWTEGAYTGRRSHSEERFLTPSPATGSAVLASTVAPDWKALCDRMGGFLDGMYRRPPPIVIDLLEEWSRLSAITAPTPSASASIASPSPVGEGQAVAWQARPIGGAQKHWTMIDARFVKDYENDGWETRPLFAAQAPKPASAGGEVVITTNESGTVCYAVTRQDEEGRILSVIWEAPAIAAEADTAKECCDCGGTGKVLTCSGYAREPCPSCQPPGPMEVISDPPAADRLAQTVSDAEVRRAEATFTESAPRYTHEHDCHPHDIGNELRNSIPSEERIRAVLEQFVRARESAPAQEERITDAEIDAIITASHLWDMREDGPRRTRGERLRFIRGNAGIAAAPRAGG